MFIWSRRPSPILTGGLALMACLKNSMHMFNPLKVEIMVIMSMKQLTHYPTIYKINSESIS